MRQKTIFTNFINIPYFTKHDLLVLAGKFNISETSLNTLIQRSIKNKTIIPLKRNYYVTNKFFREHRHNLEYKFYLSNALLKPSYISRESALQYYGLLSEATLNYHTATSIKTTRVFRNSLGIYEYRNIKEELFSGFTLVKFDLEDRQYSYAIAEPFKAIYDYLYYRTARKNIPEDTLFLILEELRIDYTELSKVQLSKLIKLFK